MNAFRSLVLFPFLFCACAIRSTPSPASDGETIDAASPAAQDAARAVGERPDASAYQVLDLLGGLGTWTGAGTAYAVGGAPLPSFDVTLVRTSAGDQKVRTEGTVTLASGERSSFWQELEATPSRDEPWTRSFRVVSMRGTGGGRCFSNGMCQIYEADGDRAFATTMSGDGPGQIRVLTTELDHGKAVRMFAQSLRRK